MIPVRDEDDPFLPRRAPVVVLTLIALNTLAQVYILIQGPLYWLTVPRSFGLIPEEVLHLHRLETLVTHLFVHGGFLHLLGNMLFLWVFGDDVERNMGHARYLLFYFLCGLGAALLYSLTTPNLSIPVIGSSGAVSGMLTGYLVLYPTRNVYTWFFFWVFRVPAFVFIFYWSALQVILGIFFLKFPNTTSIAFWAHIGGLITGFILIFFFRGERRTVAEL